MSDIKEQLLAELNRSIDSKIQAIKASIADISDSMKNDTKSSAGDKFETGREMMQIELNNKQQQLNKQLQVKKDLSQINLNRSYDKVEFGSLVMTNKGNYFMSVALGKILINQSSYFALSMASPIGQALKGATVGDKIHFNNQDIEVSDIC